MGWWQRLLHATRNEPVVVEVEPTEERLGKYKIVTRTGVDADLEGVLTYGVNVKVLVWSDGTEEGYGPGYYYIQHFHRDCAKAELHDTIREMNAVADAYVNDIETYNTEKVRYVE